MAGNIHSRDRVVESAGVENRDGRCAGSDGVCVDHASSMLYDALLSCANESTLSFHR